MRMQQGAAVTDTDVGLLIRLVTNRRRLLEVGNQHDIELKSFDL